MFLSTCILCLKIKKSFHKIISCPAPGLGLGILQIISLKHFTNNFIILLNKMPDYSNELIIFIMSFMSSSSIIYLIPSPRIFFCIPPPIADIAAVNPSGANTFLANGIATFINGPAILLNKLPKKNPPD